MPTKFLVISSSGDSLPIVQRIQAEGADVSVFIENPDFRTNHRGLVANHLNLEQLRAFPMGPSTTVLFDMVRPFDPKADKKAVAADRKLLQIARGDDHKAVAGEGIMGALADRLRDHGRCRVIGMSGKTEELELNRDAGKQLAEELGMKCPDYWVFDSVDKAIRHLEAANRDERWVLKPHGNDDLDLTYIERWSGELAAKMRTTEFAERLEGKRFIIEQFIQGVTLDEEAWFNGEKWCARNSTLERKRLLAGGLGQNVGSSLNIVWSKQGDRGLVDWDRLTHRLQEWGYVGPVNATFQVDAGGQLYFLEWCFRMGYDAVFGLFSLLRGTITNFLDNGFRVGFEDDRVAATIRVSIPPFPVEDAALRKRLAQGVPVEVDPQIADNVWLMDVRQAKGGTLECAGADGILAVVTGQRENPELAMDMAYRSLSRLRVGADLQYRSDGKEMQSDWRSLRHMRGAGVNTY